MSEVVKIESVVEIRVETVGQLFNSLDPSPFRSRDLDDDAEDHIVSWARELPARAPLKIAIEVANEELARTESQMLADAVRNYFRDRTVRIGLELREHFKLAFRYLAVGLPILVVCLMSSQAVASFISAATTARVVEESLIIVGWVANWKPIEAFLYSWWPIMRKRALYRRLSEATVEISTSSERSPARTPVAAGKSS